MAENMNKMIKLEQIAGMNQHYKYFSLDYFLDSQEKNGFKSIEFWCGAPHFWVDWKGYSDCHKLTRKAKERGLDIVSVTIPAFANQYQCSPVDEYHEARSLRYFSNGIHIASEVGAGIMTLCSGYGYVTDRKDDLWKRSADLIGKLCDLAGREGIVLALESLKRDESNIAVDLDSTRSLFDYIGHPALKITIDTIAMADAGESLEDWFEAFGSDIVHMHFLDGDPNMHNIWGDGNHSLERELRILKEYGYTGYLVQEVVGDQYFDDPTAADYRNMQVLRRFIEN